MIYFLSRVFTFAYILTSFVFQVGSVQNCAALQLALGICLILSQSTTAMLFLLRAFAVWQSNKLVHVVFILLWLGLIGADVTVPLGIRGAHIGPTMQCINTVVPANTEWVAIMALINDTVVFCAVNYRIIGFTVVDGSFKDRVRAFFGGRQISMLSRALLRSGQHFYLIAVCTNAILLVFVKLPNLPAVYHAMLTIPGFALINAMACLVFRQIKFGLLTSDGGTKPANSSTFGTISHRRRPAPNEPESGSITLNVRVQKQTEQFEDGLDGGENPKINMLA